MKASQITTRNRKNATVIRSLAVAAVLTFFAAGSTADASCEKPLRTRPVIDQDYGASITTLNEHEVERLPAGPGYGRYGLTPALRRFNPVYGNTTIPINDTARWLKKEEERRLRQAIIERLKAAGVIREPGQPATTTQSSDNSTGTTTTKPKPKPKPKPKKPKVTKLPNGDTITQYPDGRREIKMKNGDTVTTYPNGKRVIKRFNGDTTETHPSGYRKTMSRYGTGRAVYPDGTTVDYMNSGEIILTTPDGKKFSRTPGKSFKPVD